MFSKQETFAAKQELDSRNRASILAALKQSQTSGDPTQLSLGILNTYSAMSDEERQATNWTPSLRDNAVQSYKSTSSLMSMLRGLIERRCRTAGLKKAPPRGCGAGPSCVQRRACARA